MEQKEVLIEGWCSECICQNFYHVGDSKGVCIGCGCVELVQDANSEILDRLKGLILKPTNYEAIEDPEEEEQVEESIVIEKQVIFIGKVSRECSNCGDIKLFKEFNDSSDPVTLCRYCAWEAAEIAMLAAMEEKQRQEIEEMEERILENELAYMEAMERQEMIDMVLRQLDE